MSTPAPTLTLVSGARIPQIGLGTWPMDDATAERVVPTAVESGYRLIDTAENYENERGVGRGLRASGVPRAELFVTTKFNKQWHSADGARRACEASLERLGLDYLDLLLIHWPNPDQDRYVDAFRGLVELRRDGLLRAVGTSNGCARTSRCSTSRSRRRMSPGFPHWTAATSWCSTPRHSGTEIRISSTPVTKIPHGSMR